MGLSNYKMKLQIVHVPTNYAVEFPAFLEMFSDAYTQQWNSEDVYGRMDPIATFVNTRRALSIAWNVPASSFFEAQKNLKKVNNLMSFMYPLYTVDSIGGATAINQAPLLRIKFGNLIRNPQTGEGLLGYVNGFTFDPELEFGMFYKDNPGTTSTAIRPDVEYYPKTFRLNTELNVLHEHSLGYQKSADGTTFTYREVGVDNSSFPYGSGLTPSRQVIKRDGQVGNASTPAGSRDRQLPSTAQRLSEQGSTDLSELVQPGTSAATPPRPVSPELRNPDGVANSVSAYVGSRDRELPSALDRLNSPPPEPSIRNFSAKDRRLPSALDRLRGE
jgi:hypothetical protein